MITFPLAGVAPVTVSLSAISNQKLYRSPLTGAYQVEARAGDAWRAVLTFEKKRGADAAELMGTLVSSDGMIERFELSVPKYLRRGIAAAALVDGADQTGKTVNADGLGVSVSGALMKGDLIQIGTELKMVTAQVDSDGTGSAPIPFWPALRTSPADDATIELDTPTGIFMRIAPEIGWTSGLPVNPTPTTDFSIELVEDVLS